MKWSNKPFLSFLKFLWGSEGTTFRKTFLQLYFLQHGPEWCVIFLEIRIRIRRILASTFNVFISHMIIFFQLLPYRSGFKNEAKSPKKASANFSSFSLGIRRLVFGGDIIICSQNPDPFFRLILQSLIMCEVIAAILVRWCKKLGKLLQGMCVHNFSKLGWKKWKKNLPFKPPMRTVCIE